MRILLVLILACSVSVEACEPSDGDRFEIDSETILYIVFPDNAPVVSEYFDLDFFICKNHQPWSPSRISVDASMPAHKHGMNYRPEVFHSAIGRYHIRGLLLHMPGHWRFDVEIEYPGSRLQIKFDRTL
ncbi:MAG: hypothetical protein GY806_07340 [Gammaproteobacteria bacterium]|nr:hypothetical protein [Gammaproteobacteria bacterium]